MNCRSFIRDDASVIESSAGELLAQKFAKVRRLEREQESDQAIEQLER